MSKVVVFNIPLYGHVNPTLAIVEELVASGEEVIYYLTDEFKNKIESTGATFRRYEPVPKPQTQGPPPKSFTPSLYDVLSRGLTEGVEFIVPQLLDEVRTQQPDYIFYDSMCLWAKFLAKILQVPAIAFHTTYPSNEHFSLFKVFDSYNPEATTQNAEKMLALGSKLEQVCATYNMQPLEPSSLLSHNEPLNIVFIPRAFQPAGDSFDERFVFVGPCLSPRTDPTDFPLDQLGKQSTLYISLGTLFANQIDFFQMCFTAFAGQPWQVVMSIGKQLDKNALGPIPDNFILNSFVPQLAVLEHTDVFLTHGGMNSVMEALYNGVPLVVIPQMPEQGVTAGRVTELGLGVAIEKTAVTASHLHSAVAKVASEPQFREKAKQMRDVVHAAGGYKQAVNAMLQFKESLVTNDK